MFTHTERPDSRTSHIRQSRRLLKHCYFSVAAGFAMQLALSCSMVFSFVTAAGAQAVSGNVSGTVQDLSGAVLPGAMITIKDLDRGTIYQTQSGKDGNFSQTHLLAGRYQVTIESAELGLYTADATVQIDATTRIDAVMRPSSVQRIDITDATPLLVTDRAEIATTLTGAQIRQLPVLDRNVTNLLTQVPGAQFGNTVGTGENPQQGVAVNVNGQFVTANGFLLDGTENESAILGIAVINPNIDALQEFKVSTSNYDAELGAASGALIQATTKSGTNQFHGTLFEYLRNNYTNASDAFSKQNPPLRWNQFGGSLGGPILKNKLFGFGDYQGTRRRTGGNIITTVPTAAERSGDLSTLLARYFCADGSVSAGPCSNPATVPTTEGAVVPAREGMVFDPTSGDVTTGLKRAVFAKNGVVNVVPVAAPMGKLLALLPLPNRGTAADFFNNYISSGSQRFDSYQFDGRLDYSLSSSTHVFIRYTLADFNNYSPAAYGDIAGGPTPFGVASTSINRNQSVALGFDHTFTPTLITDARFGFYRYRIRQQPNGGGTPATDAGLPGLNTGLPGTSGMPAFYVNGTGGFNFGYSLGINGCNCPLKETENQFQLVNNWTKIVRSHTIKFGVDGRRGQQQRIPSDSHRSGEINFNNQTTGNPELDTLASGAASTGAGLGSYLLSDVYAFGRYYTGANYHPGLRETRLFAFVQDSWRITPKLTVSYGVRYENYLPQTAASPGGAGSFDPTTGEVLAAGIGGVPLNLGVKGYNVGFLPRVGVAYQASETTVFRVGYGETFNPGGFGSVFGQGADYNPPIVNGQSVSPNNPYLPAFKLTDGPAIPDTPPVGTTGRYLLPNGIGVNAYTYPLNTYRIPGAYSWNTAVQHRFTPDLAFELAYVGNVGRHLYQALNENQAVPGPGDFNPRRPFYPRFGLTQGIFRYCNCDNSSYHSLQAKLQKEFSHNVDFILTYTFGKAMTNTEGGSNFGNAYDVRADHGPASWDRTNTVTLIHNVHLPFGRGQHFTLGNNAIVDALVGGWRVSGVHTFESGLPFTPNVANAPLLNADFGARADVIGLPSIAHRDRNQWFNPAAYSEPTQPFRNGNARRNSLRGPGLTLSDLSLAKTLLHEKRVSLDIQADAFNVFNHVNLGLPNSQVDNPQAGQITFAQTAPRQMQFGLHVQF